MRSDFTVKIRHADKPLLGATVEIRGPQDTSSAKEFTVKTDKNGIARIDNLAPGDYWLSAEYLDIGAAYHCFHVNDRPSRKAKGNLAYDWGDLAPALAALQANCWIRNRARAAPLFGIFRIPLTYRSSPQSSHCRMRLQGPCITRHRMPAALSLLMGFQPARTYCTSTPGRLSLTATMTRVTTWSVLPRPRKAIQFY
jgi:hypothetical protein